MLATKKKVMKEPIVLKDVLGIRFIVYPWERESIEDLKTRKNSKDEFKALEKIIEKGDTVFDVGANIGIHSALFSRWAGETGRVFSFEPVPETFWLLNETIALNKCLNVRPFLLAIMDVVGSRDINVFESGFHMLSTFAYYKFGENEPVSSVNVNTETLDNFCAKNKVERIDMLKVDVEGFEKNVFEGAKSLLKNGKIDKISFEVAQIPLKGNGVDAKELFGCLYSYGYTIFKFRAETEEFIGPINNSGTFYDNFYAVRDIERSNLSYKFI